jgi:hypothetical protein
MLPEVFTAIAHTKSSQIINHVSVELMSSVSQTVSVSIIRVSVLSPVLRPISVWTMWGTEGGVTWSVTSHPSADNVGNRRQSQMVSDVLSQCGQCGKQRAESHSQWCAITVHTVWGKVAHSFKFVLLVTGPFFWLLFKFSCMFYYDCDWAMNGLFPML